MAFTLIVKNSSQAGKIPTASQIGRGELALNLVDQKLYSKNTSDDVFEIAPPGEVPSGGTTTGLMVHQLATCTTTLTWATFWFGTVLNGCLSARKLSR